MTSETIINIIKSLRKEYPRHVGTVYITMSANREGFILYIRAKRNPFFGVPENKILSALQSANLNIEYLQAVGSYIEHHMPWDGPGYGVKIANSNIEEFKAKILEDGSHIVEPYVPNY